jgi:RNA polymerase sigma-70 factor, ECF subfamily
MANASQTNASADTAVACLDIGDAAASTAARAVAALRTLGGARTSTDGSDASLVARVAQGDRRALELLFARHQQRVYRFALRLVANGATAEEIVSDVFIELWRRAASFQGRAQVSTWLLAITRNKALSALRGRIDQPLEHALAIPDPAITAEEALDAGRRGAILRACLAQLSPAHREIIDLVYYHEKSVDEASAIIGVTAATVKTRMFYARKRLADLVRAAGIATSQVRARSH